MCQGERTNFLFPDGRTESQYRYILCNDSREGRPCPRVNFVDVGTRYVPGAQPDYGPPAPPMHRTTMQHQEQLLEEHLPSLTDGRTASTVSMRKMTRPTSGGKKYSFTGSTFSFGFPFGRSKSDAKKEKEKEKEKEKQKRASKSKSKDYTVKVPSRHHGRHPPGPNAVYPEAPEPPIADFFYGQQMPAQYVSPYAMPSPNLPHSASMPHGGLPAQYPVGLDPRTTQTMVYEERFPPSIRSSFVGPGGEMGNPSPGARNPTNAPRTSRHSVKFDVPLQSYTQAQPQAGGMHATSDDYQPEEASDFRRYKLREAERDRQRQANIIEDLQAKLNNAQANEELLETKLREVEAEQQRHQQQKESFNRPPSSTGATAGSSGGFRRHRPPPINTSIAGPGYPSRSYSDRSTSRQQGADTNKTGRSVEQERLSEQVHLRRRESHRSRPSPTQPPPQSRPIPTYRSPYDPEPERNDQMPVSPLSGTAADIRADIAASIDLRHKIEDDLVRQIEADENEDTRQGIQGLPRLHQATYARLVGADRDRDRLRDPLPWDPGLAHSSPQERDRERARERRRLRHPQYAGDNLRASFERVSLGRGEEEDIYNSQQRRRRPPERPWSWERDGRQY